jgi:hypothetical protein
MTDLISSRDPSRPWKVRDEGIVAAAERRTVRVRSTGLLATLVKWHPHGGKAKVQVGGRYYIHPKTDIDLEGSTP